MVMLRLTFEVRGCAYAQGNFKNVHGKIVSGGRGGGFASDQAAPGFVALVDDLHSVLLIFGLA